MSRIKQARPSPAILIAVVALVAALGGSAVAEVASTSLSNKDKKQVKKIAKKQGKKQGKKQANKQIEKKAPGLSVATAASAETFGGLTPTRVAPFTLTNGGSQIIGTFGPFTLTATCTIAAGGDEAQVTITTSQNNSAFRGEDTGPDFDIGDTPAYVESTPLNGVPDLQEDGGVAIAPDGTELLGHQLYAGVNIFGQPGTCRFGGVIFMG